MDKRLIKAPVWYAGRPTDPTRRESQDRHVPNRARLGIDLINRTADSTTSERSVMMTMTTIGYGRVQR